MYDFDWSSIVPSMPYLLAGLVITLKITLTAIVIGIVWGTILAVMRLSTFTPIAWFAKAYVNIFRSVPLVMVLLPPAAFAIQPYSFYKNLLEQE